MAVPVAWLFAPSKQSAKRKLYSHSFGCPGISGRPFFDMFTTKQIVAIILTALILIILIQNSYSVRLKFLFAYISMPLSILVLAVLLVGVLLGYWLNRRKSHGSKR